LPRTIIDVPLHLADNSARDLSDALVTALQGLAVVRILQHGYAHVDHAPEGAGSWELGDHRPQDAVLEELALGFARLSAPPSGALPAGSGAAVDPHRSGRSSRACRTSASAALSMEGARHDALRRPGRCHAQCPLRSDQVEGRGALHRYRAGAGRDRQAIWRRAGRAGPTSPSPPDCAPITSPMTARPGTSSRH
jgi:hypothetical protein